VEQLGQSYEQLNATVGQFGTFTLRAATHAIESASAGDGVYKTTDQLLSFLELGGSRGSVWPCIRASTPKSIPIRLP
jgi:hypothetical protein